MSFAGKLIFSDLSPELSAIIRLVFTRAGAFLRFLQYGGSMAQITIQNLTFSYSSHAQDIFTNLHLTLDTDWKLGLIGGNGRGKTTLLRLLAGELPYYTGRISSPLPAAYFPYAPSAPDAASAQVIAEVRPDLEEWQIFCELSRLSLPEEILARNYLSLSEGEKTKVMLAALFAGEERFLLIDEPLNHLDREGRETLARYMAGKRGFIVASHDRRFLDMCTDHTLALNKSSIDVIRGSCSIWNAEYVKREQSEEKRNARLHKEIGRMDAAADRSGRWACCAEKEKKGARDKGYVGHKAAKMMKRAKAVQKRRQTAVEEKETLLADRETLAALKLPVLVHHENTLVTFSDVSPIYDGCTIIRPLSFSVARGDRVLLEGGNGAGKTSLLRLLLSDQAAYTGTVQQAAGLKISAVSQTTQFLRGSLDEVAEAAGADRTMVHTLLYKMGFPRIQFEKDVRELSEGQKKKVLLALSLCKEAHLYVWDEPLNFIDIRTRTQIEQMLLHSEAAMLFTEHDMAFQDAVATKRILLSPDERALQVP